MHAPPRSKPLRFRHSGSPQRHRLSWACVLCSSQVRAAQVMRCLASANAATYRLPATQLSPFEELGCFSGCLMYSASIQKLFCGIYSTFKCSFDEFVGEKVFSLSYSSAILLRSTFTFHFHALEKAMATHSSVLAWRIPGTGDPGGLLSMGSHRIGHD